MPVITVPVPFVKPVCPHSMFHLLALDVHERSAEVVVKFVELSAIGVRQLLQVSLIQ